MFTIDDIGNDHTEFYTHSGLLIAKGYKRIVYGKRGPYIEFDESHIKTDHIYIPVESTWRIGSHKSFYLEYRSMCKSYIKIYYQKRLVSYADYKIGFFYISPYDLKYISAEEYRKNKVKSVFNNLEEDSLWKI